MDRHDEIMRILGRIEGRLIGLEKVYERVAKLEMWMSWLKGGWAALIGSWVYIYKYRKFPF